MNFVLLTKDDLDTTKNAELLKDLAKAPGGTVLMFLDSFTKDEHQYMAKLVKKIIPKRSQCHRMKLSGRSAADIKKLIRDRINFKLSSSREGFMTIDSCAKLLVI